MVEETVLAHGDTHLGAGSDGHNFNSTASNSAIFQGALKAVDFIVELTDRILFIEIKDPPDPASLPPDVKSDYVEGLLSGREDADFYRKYRNSFLYEWAAERTKKPIYYLILVAFERLTNADLLARTDALKRKLPVADAVPETAGWQGSFVAGCAVFNLDTWNQAFPTYSARRISA